MPKPSETVAHTTPTLYELFYSTKEKKTYTNLGVSLLLVIVFLAFALVPTLTTLDTIRDNIGEYNKLNKGLKSKVEAFRNLSIQRNTSSNDEGLKEQIDYLDKIFIGDTHIDSLYLNLYTRARNSNVQIVSFNPKYPSPGLNLSIDTVTPLPSEYSYELQMTMVTAQFNNIPSFLNTLEGSQNMPIPVRIKNFTVIDLAETSKGQATSSTPQTATGFGLDVTLLIYLDSSSYTQPS